jgi:hypothetical protein
VSTHDEQEATMTKVMLELIDAFRRKDPKGAEALASKVSSGPHEDIERAIDALQNEVDPESSSAQELEAIVKRLTALVRIAQTELQHKLLPRIRKDGELYRKFREVHARKATPGETIVSVTGDGRETENTAKAGDWIVRNTTQAREEYIVGADKFESRYRRVGDLDEQWSRYQPLGEVRAVEVDGAVLELLGKSTTFFIEAPWGEAQRVREGDELAAPPALDEVYRIARAEFRETYERASKH